MQLWETFQTFLTWYLPQRPAGQIYLNGSFVTDKAIPDDIDMVTDLSDCDDAELWRALLFLHENQAAIKQRFHVDFWFNFPGGNDLASYFQYVGTKTGAIKGMDSKHHKGILRIIE